MEEMENIEDREMEEFEGESHQNNPMGMQDDRFYSAEPADMMSVIVLKEILDIQRAKENQILRATFITDNFANKDPFQPEITLKKLITSINALTLDPLATERYTTACLNYVFPLRFRRPDLATVKKLGAKLIETYMWAVGRCSIASYREQKDIKDILKSRSQYMRKQPFKTPQFQRSWKNVMSGAMENMKNYMKGAQRNSNEYQ